MSAKALQSAIECLRIRDIWLHDSRAWVGEGHDPDVARDHDVHLQFKHFVGSSTLFEVSGSDGPFYLFRVQVEVGARLLPKPPVAPEAKSETTEGTFPEILAQIEATFIAEYKSVEDPGKDALEAFAQKNVSYHVWPYWREYLSSHCVRMHLPKVTLPAVQFPNT